MMRLRSTGYRLVRYGEAGSALWGTDRGLLVLVRRGIRVGPEAGVEALGKLGIEGIAAGRVVGWEHPMQVMVSGDESRLGEARELLVEGPDGYWEVRGVVEVEEFEMV